MCPFEGNREADVAPGDNESDAPASEGLQPAGLGAGAPELLRCPQRPRSHSVSRSPEGFRRRI